MGATSVKKHMKINRQLEGRIQVICAKINVNRLNFWNLDSRDDLKKFHKHVQYQIRMQIEQNLEIDVTYGDAHVSKKYFYYLINDNIYLLQRTFSNDSFF